MGRQWCRHSFRGKTFYKEVLCSSPGVKGHHGTLRLKVAQCASIGKLVAVRVSKIMASWRVQSLRALISDLGEGNGITHDVVDGYRWRIEMIYRDLLAQELLHGLQQLEREALDYLAQAYSAVSHLQEVVPFSENHSVSRVQQVLDGRVGRPYFEISSLQLQYLIDNRFSVPQIAQMMGVSVSTIRRRMTAFNMSIHATYSTLTDDELDELILSVQQRFPNWGNRQMYGHLISMNIRVQFHRVRESQCRIDPYGTMMRQLQHLKRRSYSVRGPQHLWHIDGNHKLIR